MELNYEEILDNWAEKVITKADKLIEKLDSLELGSKEYWKYKCYSDALYMAIVMLNREEHKYKNKRKINKNNNYINELKENNDNEQKVSFLDIVNKYNYCKVRVDNKPILQNVLDKFNEFSPEKEYDYNRHYIEKYLNNEYDFLNNIIYIISDYTTSEQWKELINSDWYIIK